MTRRRTSKPPAPDGLCFSEIDALLLEYVLDESPAEQPPDARAQEPSPQPSERRAETVDPGHRRWSFERAAVRNSMRRLKDAPWYAQSEEDDEDVA